MITATEQDVALRVDVWTDFACPACYLAKPRLDAAVAATGRAAAIAISYHAWELFPDATAKPFDSLEHVVHKFGGDETQARRLEERMRDLASAQDQPYLRSHPVARSVDAHRVLKLVAEHGRAGEFIDRLQRELFGRGTNVFGAEYLTTLGAELGIDAARVAAVLAGDEFADEVRADQARGRALGLTGIPFTVLGSRRAVLGLIGADALQHAIEAALDTRNGAE